VADQENKNNGEALPAEVVFGDRGPPIPYTGKMRFVSDKKIIELWFKFAPEVDNFGQLACRVATALFIPREKVERVIKKARLRELAKEQRELITQELYAEKMPIAKAIVGMSLAKLEDFLKHYRPVSIDGAKELKNIAVDMNNLLRLETGKSTANVDIHVTTQNKSAEEILAELKVNDPFKDYASNG